MMTSWASRYVGLPFKDFGRDFSGVDCWGLVRLVLKQEKNIDVPAYGETSALDLEAVARMVSREAFIEPWIAVMPHAAQPFDVAVMYRRIDRIRCPIHVGIMVNRWNVLHIEEKISAVMVPVDHPTITCRQPRFFRHKDLIQNNAA